MKMVFRLSLLGSILAIILAACVKEKSIDTGGIPGAATQWQFKEAGVSFKGNTDTAVIETTGSLKTLVIEGVSSDGTGSFLLEVSGINISTGTYKTPAVVFQYSVGGIELYENDPAATDKFSVTITKIDANEVSGNFGGEVKDALGNTKNITEGKFSAKFKTAPAAGNGQLLLWSKKSCSGGGNIIVKVENQSGTISSFPTNEPACGATGSATFTLPAGTYTWKAFCGTDSIVDAVTITAGSCTKREVVFPAPGTLCRLSNIAFYDPVNNTAEGSITSFFNASNKVIKIQVFDSVQSSLDAEFNLSYATNRINVDAQQYFNLGPGERIQEFHGFVEPMDNTSPEGIFSYQYDASGYMTKCLVALKAFPTIPVLDLTYTWTGGNLTRIEIKQAGTNEKTVIEYQYDLTKQARSFLCFFPNSELILFQTAINYGKNSTNLVVKSTIKDYDASGAVINTEVADFGSHVYDANGYIRSFVITGGESVYDTDVKYVLSYKCQ
jgi:hypothetical protein